MNIESAPIGNPEPGAEDVQAGNKHVPDNLADDESLAVVSLINRVLSNWGHRYRLSGACIMPTRQGARITMEFDRATRT
jgi:hypothetical protein